MRRAWLHRDQKVWDASRDRGHAERYPSVHALDRSYQSSLYLTDYTTSEPFTLAIERINAKYHSFPYYLQIGTDGISRMPFQRP